MRVDLRTISNRSFVEECDPEMLVSELKDRISMYGLQRSSMKFTYRGKVLDDDMTLESAYNGSGFIIVTVPRVSQKTITPPMISEPVSQPLPPEPEDQPKPLEISKDRPSVAALPSFVDARSKYDPVSFEMDIQQLQMLGFPRADCEEALRTAFYDIELASTYLIDGIPRVPSFKITTEAFDDEEEEDSVVDEEQSVDKVKRVLRMVQKGKVEYSRFVEWIQVAYPQWAFGLLHNPIEFFQEFGFDPALFPWQQTRQNKGQIQLHEEMMMNFSEDEQKAIHRIEEKGYDTMMVIQVYSACQKNEAQTLECLNNM